MLILYAALFAAMADAESIPLKDIWAFEIPGTKDIHELEPEAFGEEAKQLPVAEREERYKASLVTQIHKSLMYILGSNKLPEPRTAFAVLGTGREALRKAAAVLV